MASSNQNSGTNDNNRQLPNVLSTMNPYYIGANENTSASLINPVLTGQNFYSWRRAMEIAIGAKNKLGFISGNLICPSVNDPWFSAWTQCNLIVMSWILNSVSMEIGQSILYVDTAAKMWKELNERFSQSNEARIYELHKEIHSCFQEQLSVAAYFTKIETLWNDRNLSKKTLDWWSLSALDFIPVPVLALKEQIATVTGVLSEQQRLICRGKVLKDDHVLSAYHVEDGHTLHLVVRQPLYPSLDSSVDHSANDPVLSSGHRVNQSGSNAAEETFNISEWDDEYPPEVIQVLSRIWSSSEGSDLNEATPEGPFRSTLGGLRYHDGRQTDQTAASGQSNPGIGGTSFFASAPLDRLQLPQVIPDSLATLSQYLDRMRNAFTANVRDSSISSQGGGNIVINGQDDTNARAVSGGLPTPASLADVILSTRQLLMDQSADSLSQLARQLMDQTNVTDPLARMATQSNAIRTGVLLQQLGALLLELGRTTMTLRMGQTPTEALVTAGPAVFISSSGPSPFMVQPLHFQTAESFGEIPTGTGHGGSGLSEGSVGSGFFPRNIDIRISTGSLASSTTPTASQREATGVQQPSRQSNQSSHGRNVVAALPASVVRVSANTIRFSVGLTYPNLARMRRVSGQQPYSSSTVPQAGSGLTRGDANLSAGDGAQNVRGSSLDISSGLDRLLMSVFPGEDIYASGVNTQGMGTTSATSDSRIIQGETATTSQESAPVFEDDDPFSFLLHQFLPRRSQSTAGGSAAGGGEEDVIENRNTQTSSTQDHEIANRGTRSRRHGNPPSSPSSKRLRR